jgi:hypothetical protein
MSTAFFSGTYFFDIFLEWIQDFYNAFDAGKQWMMIFHFQLGGSLKNN